MRKPPFISHYLVLKDLIKGIDPRVKSPKIDYLCSRIENIKNHFKTKDGLRFDENAKAYGKYAPYKPYILIDDKENIELAHILLKRYKTDNVIQFLGLTHLEDEV